MKPTTIIVGGIILVAAIAFILNGPARPAASPPAGANVAVVDGTQIVTLKAKGGYQPGTSAVKAGMPTILRIETDATFDCSSQVRIPSLGIEKSLPPAGRTDITLGSLQPGTLEGTCAMGMYRFSIEAT